MLLNVVNLTVVKTPFKFQPSPPAYESAVHILFQTFLILITYCDVYT